MFLTIEKAQDFNRVISELTDDKTKLEDLYFKTRADMAAHVNENIYLQTKAIETEKALKQWQGKNSSDLSDKLIDMSNTLQNLMIAEGQSKRRVQELEERHNYQTKMLSNKNADLNELQLTVARLEKDMRIKQEEWRRTDNERQQRYVQSKLGEKEDDSRGFQRPQTAGPMASTMATNLNAQDNRAAKDLERRNQELANKVQELQSENRQLVNLQEQLMVGGGNQDQKQMIEQYSMKYQNAHQEESKQMADAAYQTIKTLNDMLDQKKVTIRNKDAQIQSLRDDLTKQREMAAEMQLKLVSEVTATGKNTLSNLAAMVDQDHHKQASKAPKSDHARAQISDMERQKTDVELQNLRNRFDDLELKYQHEKEQVVAERRAKLTAEQEHKK